MRDVFKTLSLVLLALTLWQVGLFAARVAGEIGAAHGLVQADGISPLGGDFINLFTAGQLAVTGKVGAIYQPDAFMAAERAIVPAYIGLRLWAYPPHSLFLAAPFGQLGFAVSFVLWSGLGLIVLGWGARRIGLGWIETVIVVLSPAALSSIYYGQTGNLVGGLLLLALAGRRPADGISIVSAALLTVKPQAGLLLPVFWLVNRRFGLIFWTIAAIAVLLLASLAVFGLDAWRDYLGATLNSLNALERHGSGPFLYMIPSTFIAVRLLGGDAALAGAMHWGLAAVVGVAAVWRLVRSTDRNQQIVIVLVATAIVTPYIHVYDLAPLLAAALLSQRLWAGASRLLTLLGALVVLVVWALPALIPVFNLVGVPATPLLLLAMLGLVAWPLSARGGRAESQPIAVVADGSSSQQF